MSEESQKGCSEKDLECQICLSLICEPVTIPCGHSFCRVCLVQAMRRSNKQCVTCRAVCHISPEDASENVMLKNIACAINPEVYAARKAEVQIERQTWQLQHPVFFYNTLMFPGEILKLHLFEPRYKEMMRRATSGPNCFAYVCVRDPSLCSVLGSVALLAKVARAQFTPDGRCFVMAVLQFPRYIISEVYEEPGTGGLHYARLEPLQDAPTPLPPAPADGSAPPGPPPDAPGQAVVELMAECRMLSDILFPEHQYADDFAPLPASGAESFSLHVMGRINGTRGDDGMARYCSSRDTLERLRACAEALHALHSERIAHSMSGGVLQTAVSSILGAIQRLREGGAEEAEGREEELDGASGSDSARAEAVGDEAARAEAEGGPNGGADDGTGEELRMSLGGDEQHGADGGRASYQEHERGEENGRRS